MRPGFTLQPDAGEVADVFEVPLAFLMDPSRHERRLFRWDGGERQFYAMPYPREDGGTIEGRRRGTRRGVHEHADGAAREHDHHPRAIVGLAHVAAGSSGWGTRLDGPWTGL